MLFITDQEIKGILDYREVIEWMREVFEDYQDGKVVMPLRINMEVKEGSLLVMPCYLMDKALSCKLITIYPKNPKIYKRDTAQAWLLLFDIKDGSLISFMEANYITLFRTASCSALATKFLARKDSKILSIVGTGKQARAHLEALNYVMKIEELKVYSPNPDHRRDFVKFAENNFSFKVKEAKDIYECLEADVIVTATTSKEPLFDGSKVKEGTHINAIGAHSPKFRELDEIVIKRSKLIVDSREAALKEAGEILLPLKEGKFDENIIYGELGEIIKGKKKGRESDDEITIFKSLGLAMEDAICAYKIYKIFKK
ncbi:Delta(1)-pyrroline-2-carboxylate reductase [archaeon HR06]|nr:Delta(1)-pyrroline-2-carboxylate reductase [archaeon HR06]